MSIPRKTTRTQLDSVPQANQSHGTGDDPQPEASAPTPSPGGTTGAPRPVPIRYNVLFEEVDPADLAAFLENTPPAVPPGIPPLPPPQTCPTCGRAYDLFDPPTSRLLDLVLVSREALSTATAALSTLTHALEEDLP